MKKETLETGIWKLEVTLYLSGNFIWKLTNKITGAVSRGKSFKVLTGTERRRYMM